MNKLGNADEEVKGVIKLGDYVQDDVGTQWHVIIEQRHHSEPDVTRFVLKEHCLASREPRVAIVKSDGTQFTCKASAATGILSILAVKP